MKNFTSIALATFVTTSLLAGCVGGDNESADEPAQDDDIAEPTPDDQQPAPEPKFLPKGCSAIADHDPAAADGEYTLYVDGDEAKPWTAYCHNIANGGATFLPVHAALGKNVSAYLAGGAAFGTDVVTQYTKLRIDPSSLVVDISDQTFATSTGTLDHPGEPTPITSMPFGIAMACGGGVGVANIDLVGTEFALADKFDLGGAGPYGMAEVTSDAKEAKLSGGGGCGWIGPDNALYNPFNKAGGYVLQLTYSP